MIDLKDYTRQCAKIFPANKCDLFGACCPNNLLGK